MFQAIQKVRLCLTCAEDIAIVLMTLRVIIEQVGLAESEKLAVLAIDMSKEDMSAFGLASNLGKVAKIPVFREK